MTMTFKPPLLAIFATITIASIFITLGKWQLNRAAEKDAIYDKFAIEQQQAPVMLMDHIDNIEQWRYRKVYIHGTPLSDRQFLLDNQVRNMRPGFNVITPFQLADNRTVLVDRGWIPLGKNRSDIQNIDIARTPLRIEGYLYTPHGEAFTLGTMDEGQINWPRIINYLDFDTMGERLGTTLNPLTIRMHPDQTLGFRRDWPIAAMSSNKHRAYAVQWFALALAIIIIFLILNIKLRK